MRFMINNGFIDTIKHKKLDYNILSNIICDTDNLSRAKNDTIIKINHFYSSSYILIVLKIQYVFFF